MSYTKKSLEELNVLDDFLMNAIVSAPEIGEVFCKTVLSVLLQRKIGKLRIVSQRMIPPCTPKHRGIRMDVEVQEFETDAHDMLPINIYDLEPNLQKGVHLPRHNRCMEVDELKYDDGLEFVYFYTGGHKGGNESIKAMLNYFQHSQKENAVDKATEEISRIVEQIRILPEVRNEYMTLGDIIDREREEEASMQLISYVDNLKKNLGMDLQTACTALGITEEAYQRALELQEEE